MELSFYEYENGGRYDPFEPSSIDGWILIISLGSRVKCGCLGRKYWSSSLR